VPFIHRKYKNLKIRRQILSKKQIYYEEAERLYVTELLSLREIASKLKVSQRVLSYWKKDNNWEEKKREYIESQQSVHGDMYKFAKSLLKNLMEDSEKGEKIDAPRLHFLSKLVPMMAKLKQYEDTAMKKEVSENRTTIPPETIKELEEKVLGIRRHEKH
jgi:hypothetical protein